MSKKVILLNSPPYSGKDYAANFLVDRFGFHKQEFKEPLFQAVKTAFGIGEEIWNSFYTVEKKDLPTHYLIYGSECISPRRAMINMSENVLKPLFGDKVFGIAAANQLKEGTTVFSDSGFMGEAQALIDVVGKDNLYVIKIIKEGCTFEGDSRNWLDTDKLGVRCMTCINTGDDRFHQNLLDALHCLGSNYE